jgi:hypothetical protein
MCRLGRLNPVQEVDSEKTAVTTSGRLKEHITTLLYYHDSIFDISHTSLVTRL